MTQRTPTHRGLPAAAIALTLIAPAAAQTYESSPPGFLGLEGQHYASYLGMYASQRMQMVDGTIQGTTTKILQGIAFRVDGSTVYSDATGAGRTWTKTELRLGDADFATFGTSFATNQNPSGSSGATTSVFASSSVSWPALSGAAPSVPAPWGMDTPAGPGALTFPFSTPYVYTGNFDLLLDFTFDGGALQNQAAWTTFKYYYLDSKTMRVDTLNGQAIDFTDTVTCADSAVASGNALTTMSATAYDPNYTADPSRAGRVLLTTNSYRSAPGAAVIHAIAPAVLANPVPIGGCHALALDPAVPWATFGLTASTAAAPFATQQFLFLHQPSYSGVRVYAQAAWADSATNALSLTLHKGLIVPDMPYTVIPERACCYSSSATAATGAVAKTNFGNPFIRYQM